MSLEPNGPTRTLQQQSSPSERPRTGTVSVSVVIPCLNEEKTIAACVHQALSVMDSAGVLGEVVVADNGSSDASVAEAARAGARVTVVTTPGYGAAIRGGIDASTGDLVVIGDGDGQHDFVAILDFVDKLTKGYDVVVGNRLGKNMAPGAMKWSHRYVGNPLLSGLLRLLFRPKVHDAQCGMRALTRAAYEQLDLRTSGFEFAPEMVVKAARARLRLGEIPIDILPDRRQRPAHLKTVPDGWRHLMFLLMCAPNWLFVAPGGALLLLGIAIVSWLFVGPQHISSVPVDTRTELFGVLVSSIGFQIMSIGMFARVFSYSEPRRFRARVVDRVLRNVKLEQGLALSGVLLAIGTAGGIYDYVSWATKGFGVFGENRAIIFFALWFVLGVQVGFASLFLSMIGVSRHIWIGDER